MAKRRKEAKQQSEATKRSNKAKQPCNHVKQPCNHVKQPCNHAKRSNHATNTKTPKNLKGNFENSTPPIKKKSIFGFGS
jgi:hypothetical protein